MRCSPRRRAESGLICSRLVERSDAELLAAWRAGDPKAGSRLPTRVKALEVPPRVILDNGASKVCSVIEINGHDRPGFLFLAKFGNITVVAGLGFELKSIAAVVVGGVSIMGVTGSMIGVLMGALLVDTIDNSLTRWAVVSEFWRDALLGGLIMAAVTLDTLASRQLTKLRKGGAE